MTSNLTEKLWVLVTYGYSKALNSCFFPGVDMDFDMHPDRKNIFIIHLLYTGRKWLLNNFSLRKCS